MNTCKCEQCDEFFWCDEPNQGLCPTCKEAPSEQANSERAIEQGLRYIQSLQQKPVVR